MQRADSGLLSYLEGLSAYTGDVHTVYNGEAFTVKCNLSDIHPNIEISTEQGYSGHKFSPQIGGDGKLITNADVHDITDYSVTVSYVQGE